MRLTILVGLGLVAFASSAPTELGRSTSPTTSPAFWVDTQTQKHYCAGRDVIRCENTAGNNCIAIDTCETYCFKHDKGVACVDMGKAVVEDSNIVDPTAPKVSVPPADVSVAARATSPQENKHFVCSKDRKGVLICKYGFCSTDYYCKIGEECNDESLSCKRIPPHVQGSKTEIRTVADRNENAPLKLNARSRSPKETSTYICSKDRASVLKCTYGFCATDYYCAKGHPCVDNPARCKKALAT
ncbi:hypothetical protein OPT61_g5280 [Boeremia exigua]|uniref:Uncharacterized protein n=1 Tax=Boeremia exigua TaxID=749465 RepID=A0ACC2IB68_9PLEO|nr:hypothetical protein OPT61_g5280 [Boeremia exigua]